VELFEHGTCTEKQTICLKWKFAGKTGNSSEYGKRPLCF